MKTLLVFTNLKTSRTAIHGLELISWLERRFLPGSELAGFAQMLWLTFGETCVQTRSFKGACLICKLASRAPKHGYFLLQALPEFLGVKP